MRRKAKVAKYRDRLLAEARECVHLLYGKPFMSQSQPPAQTAGRNPWPSRIALAVGEIAYVVAIFAVAGWITNLLVPMPFGVVSGRYYYSEEAEAITRTFDRRYWVGWLVLIPCVAVLYLLRYITSRLIKNRGPDAK